MSAITYPIQRAIGALPGALPAATVCTPREPASATTRGAETMATATVEAVQTGFLTGNLFSGWIEGTGGIDAAASAARYADLLHDELSERYPRATIDVNYQEGEGSLPITCQTLVEVSDEDEAWRVRADAERDVDEIAGDLYTRLGDNGAYVWVVEA